MKPPPVLFIPGMMLDERMYAAQISALSPAFDTVAGDITRSTSIEALASDVLNEAPERFALVGLSLGGIVALEVYRQARERVTHLALLDTTPHCDLPERGAARLDQMAAVERGGLAQLLETSLMPLYLAERNRTNLALLESILEMGLALGPDVFRRQSLALRNRCDRLPMLPSIECPALVLCGREDQLCPARIHADMATAIPRADLVVLCETGHLAAMEEPTAVTAALQHLLRRS